MTSFLFDDAPNTGRSYVRSQANRRHDPVVFSPQDQARFLTDLSGLHYDARLAHFVVATYSNRIDATVDPPPFMLDFGELYLMNIIDLGKQLLEARKDIADKKVVSREQRQDVRHLLHEYCRSPCAC